MTTIQGIIQKGIVNAQVQFDRMGYVSSNVANYNTNGYKAVRFEQMLGENGYLTGIERTDYSPAAIQRTSRDFDVAIKGIFSKSFASILVAVPTSVYGKAPTGIHLLCKIIFF